MVFHGILGTCSFFKIACVCAYFEKSLLRDNPRISPQGCDEVVLKIVLKSVGVKFVCLSKYLGTIYLLEKSLFVFL